MSPSNRDETEYSPRLAGDPGNYGWTVRGDEAGGYLGVTQWKDGAAIERVLLSPEQVEALIRFYRQFRPEMRRRRAAGRQEGET